MIAHTLLIAFQRTFLSTVSISGKVNARCHDAKYIHWDDGTQYQEYGDQYFVFFSPP
jgi:hypothetical protein